MVNESYLSKAALGAQLKELIKKVIEDVYNNFVKKTDSVSASIFSEKIGTPSSHPAIGSSYKPVFVNSNGVVEEVAYGSWDQTRSSDRINDLEPRFVKSTAIGYLPAMSQNDELYFRVDNGTYVGGRWFFSINLPNISMHISFRANIHSNGSPNVVIDEFSGYDDVNYGIKQVIVRNASDARYAIFIKVVANDTVTANSRQWQVGSTNTNASPTIYTKNEYNALTTNVVFTLPVRATLLASSCKHYYRDKIMVYGTGGYTDTPVYVDTNGEVKPCSSITAEYANKVTRQDMAANASYAVPVIDGNGVVRTDPNTPQKLNYTSHDNLLNVNVSGTSASTNKLVSTDVSSSTSYTYSVPFLKTDGTVCKDGDSVDPKLTYRLSDNTLYTNISGRAASTDHVVPSSISNGTYSMPAYDGNGKIYNGPSVVKDSTKYTVYANISGNAATATNASSVNGMKIVRGTYGGVENTIYFC